MNVRHILGISRGNDGAELSVDNPSATSRQAIDSFLSSIILREYIAPSVSKHK